MRLLLTLAISIWATIPDASAAEPPACQDYAIPKDVRADLNVWPQKLPAPDYFDVLRKCLRVTSRDMGQPPSSPWLQSEAALFTRALGRTKADLLVVPFQVQGYGLDRAERLIMSADLAYQLGRGQRVADPFLVARALGDGARRYERSAVVKLAQKVGAHEVVMGYVGHDRQHHMTLTMKVFKLDPNDAVPVPSKELQKDWRAVPFSDANPPILVFHRMLPDVVRALSLRRARPNTRGSRVTRVRFPMHIPASFAKLARGPSAAVNGSIGLTLLGALSPSHPALSREHLFERAFVSSLHFDAFDTKTDFIRAYALMELGLRPAALALIRNAKESADIVLRALLNGNLPVAVAAQAKVTNPFLRALLAVQIDDVRIAYGEKRKSLRTESVALFGAEARDWQELFAARSQDEDKWSVESAAEIKRVLDDVYPLAGLDLQSLTRGGIVLLEPVDDIAIDTATIRHIRRFVEAAAPVPCCTLSSSRLSLWDIVFLLEGRDEARIAKDLNLMINLQALPQDADRALNRYEQIFSGDPLIEAFRAELYARLGRKAADDQRQIWLARSKRSAVLAAYWSPGQNDIAYRGLLALGFTSKAATPYVDAYGFDYPREPFWPLWFYGEDRLHDLQHALLREAFANSRTDMGSLSLLLRGASTEEKSRLAGILNSPRFVGNAHRESIMAALEPPKDAGSDPVARARAAITRDPNDPERYMRLGNLLITRNGHFDEAAKVFLRDPRFHDRSPVNPVRVSNDAYTAASKLYWLGRPELALPLYEVAVDLRTGSDAGIMGAVRLKILARDYLGAARGLWSRTQRYPSAYAYRDYFSFLHALGLSDEAWSGFLQVDAAFENPAVWQSALVGQRKAARSEREIRAWLERPGIREAKFRARRFALSYAILANAVDRMPPEDLGKLLASLEGPPTARLYEDGILLALPQAANPAGLEIVVPSRLRLEHIHPLPKGTPIPSELVYFGFAYADLRHGRFKKAAKEFETLADHYPIEDKAYSYVLPYFAQAAAKTGDAVHLESFLLKQTQSDSNFDYLLARAYFAGERRDASEALRLLRHAFRLRPTGADRPIPSAYQYAKACEWLYQETKDSRFLDRLLAWVSVYQVIDPTWAWPYSMEYAYARTAERRVRALAMTIYLDPLSPRIRSATPEERTRAKMWAKANNPFIQHESDADQRFQKVSLLTRRRL